MSEPKLISPLLDNFVMGDPISDRGGVRACPAMRQDNNDKYIVKIISTPANPSQLDALLLSGAYTDRADALAYYKEVCETVVNETQILSRLSELEGFFAYEGCQVVESDDETGFDVYLLSPYRRSLRRYLSKNSMTHLGALNLGLDLCTALSLCRRYGYLYVNLKPENIYMTPDQTFKIGDIGFLPMNSLKYASLPDRYRSAYTAPEISDAYAALNTTLDVYAVGLILYQAFNAGQLPHAVDGTFPPPDYADYEMAEIILKACAPDPSDRWQDPAQMGQALVSYMQRNGAHDTPIVPPPVFQPEEPTEAPAVCEAEEQPADTEAIPVQEDGTEEIQLVDPIQEAQPETAADDSAENAQQPQDHGDDSAPHPNAPAYREDDFGNLSFLSDPNEEPLSEEELGDVSYEQISVEVSDMLSQADDLIAHPTPDPVIPPEPVEVTIPQEPEISDIEETQLIDLDGSAADPQPVDDGAAQDEDDQMSAPPEQTEEDDEENIPTPKPKGHWLRNTLLVILLLAILAGGFYFYKTYYLKTIDSLLIFGENLSMTVIVETDTDESLLSVVCHDTYGNQVQSPVVNGRAVFDDLSPDCAYSVKVVISGFHGLTGEVNGFYATPAQTNIAQFHAVTGAEDGSVIVSFTIEGPDVENWILRRSAEGEEPAEVTFSGHMYTFTGLTIGTEYTFELLPAGEHNVVGTNQLTHTASKIVSPEDLIITNFADGKLSLAWRAPEDSQVAEWTVHCSNDKGYEQTIVTSDLSAIFEGITLTDPYTVEVTAADMSVSERINIAANSVTVSGLSVTAEDDALKVQWKNGNNTPNDGWILQYTIDGSAVHEIKIDGGNTVSLYPVTPDCAYTFNLLTAKKEMVIGGSLHYTAPASKPFSGYGVSADRISFNMCKTPSFSGWDRYDLRSSDYTTDFEIGEKASFLVRLHKEYDTSRDNIVTQYVIRDQAGNIVSTAYEEGTWTSMWYRNYGEFDIPSLPSVAGKYKISIYFNGDLAGEVNFTVSQ